MSRMTRRTVPSRKVRPCTRYSRNAQRSIVVLLNMTTDGAYFTGRTVKGAYPRFLARTYYWSVPYGLLPGLTRAPRWLDIRTRGL